MTARTDPPAVTEVKARAWSMKSALAAQGQPVEFIDCLHALARQAGCSDWRSYGALLRVEAGVPATRRGQR